MTTRDDLMNRFMRACYQIDAPAGAWLQAVAHELHSVLDIDDLGLSGGVFRCPHPNAFRPERLFNLGMSERLEALLAQGLASLSPSYIASTFLVGGIGAGSSFPGWGAIEPVRSGALKSAGLSDTCAIRVADWDGSGIWFVSFRRECFALTDAEWQFFAAVRAHLGAAHRLRNRYPSSALLEAHAEAILDAEGRVLHALGPARSAAARTALRRAVTRDPEREQSVSSAKAVLVEARWTLIEQFEHSGRKYVLALENAPPAPSSERLSPREKTVLQSALEGKENKRIAFELGLADATVRVLLARAARKLGATGRKQLLELAAQSLAIDGSEST